MLWLALYATSAYLDMSPSGNSNMAMAIWQWQSRNATSLKLDVGQPGGHEL